MSKIKDISSKNLNCLTENVEIFLTCRWSPALKKTRNDFFVSGAIHCENTIWNIQIFALNFYELKYLLGRFGRSVQLVPKTLEVCGEKVSISWLNDLLCRIFFKKIWRSSSWLRFIVDSNMMSHTQTLVRMCSVRRFRSSQLPPFLQPLSCPLPASGLITTPSQVEILRHKI